MFKRTALALAAAGALLAGCGPKAPSPTIHQSMTEVIVPQAQTIWDITNAAYNDAGSALDPAKISDADWTKIEQAAGNIRQRALLMSKEKKLVVAAPGVVIEGGDDPAEPHAAQVQAHVDANPKLFRERAKILAEAAEKAETAAHNHQVGPVFDVASNLDGVCDGCHARFWDPESPQAPK
jgi:hypothetical protein